MKNSVWSSNLWKQTCFFKKQGSKSVIERNLFKDIKTTFATHWKACLLNLLRTYILPLMHQWLETLDSSVNSCKYTLWNGYQSMFIYENDVNHNGTRSLHDPVFSPKFKFILSGLLKFIKLLWPLTTTAIQKEKR